MSAPQPTEEEGRVLCGYVARLIEAHRESENVGHTLIVPLVIDIDPWGGQPRRVEMRVQLMREDQEAAA